MKDKKADALLYFLKKEPVLSDEDELFDDIMKLVSESDQKNPKRKGKVVLKVLRNALKVAAVFLVMIFGYEQYILVSKMVRLENTVGNTRSNTAAGIKSMFILNIGSKDFLQNKKDFKNTRNSDLGSKLRNARSAPFLSSNTGDYQINFLNTNN